jgi:hypothetical protein
MMRFVALAAVGALGLAVTARALPAHAAPLPLIKADYWCGPGWHLDRWNRCVRDVRYYGFLGWGFNDRDEFRSRDRDDFRFRDRDEGRFRDRDEGRERGDFGDRDRGDHGERGGRDRD